MQTQQKSRFTLLTVKYDRIKHSLLNPAVFVVHLSKGETGIGDKLRKDRLIVGLICIALAVWLFLSGTTSGVVAPAITIAILGIVMVAIAVKK